MKKGGRKYNLAFIGFGTVGQGLARLLRDKGGLLREKHGFEYAVVAVSDVVKGSVYHRDGLDLEKLLSLVQKQGVIHDYPEGVKGWDSLRTIREAGADIIVEVTYADLKTGEPAITHVWTALSHGKHVVTTNKGPAALALKELLALAAEKGVFFKFEGTVLSGTPAINMGLRDLAGTEVSRIRGILNGTTNFILTQMEEGKDYQEALSRAQELGYAEAKPDVDVEGWDAVAKIVVLANVLMGADLRVDQVERMGITGLTLADIEEARGKGRRWKLIAQAWREDEGVKARVAPEQVPLQDLLAHIQGVTNALTLVTDALGEVTIIGPGAGGREAGYALLSDMLDIHRSLVGK